jgi:hypothetical protein
MIAASHKTSTTLVGHGTALGRFASDIGKIKHEQSFPLCCLVRSMIFAMTRGTKSKYVCPPLPATPLHVYFKKGYLAPGKLNHFVRFCRMHDGQRFEDYCQLCQHAASIYQD